MEPPPPTAALSRSFERFGWRLFAELPAAGNLLVSPLSVAAALAALAAGARGATRRQLDATLGLGDGVAADAVAALLAASTSRHAPGYDEAAAADGMLREVEVEVLRLAVASALFVAAGYPLDDGFRRRLAADFGADLAAVDFAAPEAAAGRINAWVAERTGGRIGELVAAADLEAATRLVLVNAVHFKARWEETFPPGATAAERFHLDGGGSVEVPTMRQQAAFAYARTADGAVEVLHLPYEGEAAMTLVLPAPGRRAEVERRLCTGDLEALLAAGVRRPVALRLPRFALRTEAELAPALQRLGVACAFDPRCADFGGVTPHPEGLFLGSAVHQAWMEVDEEGTEAAAATALMTVAIGAPEEPEEPIPFVVDRPFCFVVRDLRTRAALFVGRVLDPTA